MRKDEPSARREHTLHLEAAGQVTRQLGVVRNDASQIKDLLHAGPCGRTGKVVRQNEIHVFEPRLSQPGRQHRMDEIDRVVRTLEGAFRLQHGEQIALPPFHGRQFRCRRTPQGNHIEVRGQHRKQSRAHKTGGTGHRNHRTLLVCHHAAIKHALAAGASPSVSPLASSAGRESRSAPFPRPKARAEPPVCRLPLPSAR